MRNIKRRTNGITLVELVIYMGILSVILVIFIDLFALLFDKQLETQSISAVQQDSNYILSRLPYEFGRAQSVEIPATAGAVTNSLRLMTDSDIYDFYLLNNNLVREHNGEIEQVNGYDTTATNLTFRRLGENNAQDVVQIELVLSSKAKKQSGNEVNQFSTTLGIREKQ